MAGTPEDQDREASEQDRPLECPVYALGAIADEQREHKERLRSLLSEVAANYTRDDDLPDDLLPRIDAALAQPDNTKGV